MDVTAFLKTFFKDQDEKAVAEKKAVADALAQKEAKPKVLAPAKPIPSITPPQAAKVNEASMQTQAKNAAPEDSLLQMGMAPLSDREFQALSRQQELSLRDEVLKQLKDQEAQVARQELVNANRQKSFVPQLDVSGALGMAQDFTGTPYLQGYKPPQTAAQFLEEQASLENAASSQENAMTKGYIDASQGVQNSDFARQQMAMLRAQQSDKNYNLRLNEAALKPQLAALKAAKTYQKSLNILASKIQEGTVGALASASYQLARLNGEVGALSNQDLLSNNFQTLKEMMNQFTAKMSSNPQQKVDPVTLANFKNLAGLMMQAAKDEIDSEREILGEIYGSGIYAPTMQPGQAGYAANQGLGKISDNFQQKQDNLNAPRNPEAPAPRKVRIVR